MNDKPTDNQMAVWHILQLAEQGRQNEVIAQMLASAWVSGDVDATFILEDIQSIKARTLNLMTNNWKIWDGLLAGGPGEPSLDLVTIKGEEYVRLRELEASTPPKLATVITVCHRVDRYDDRWLVWITDVTQVADHWMIGQHAIMREPFYTNISHPNSDQMNEGMTLEVNPDAIMVIPAEDVAAFLDPTNPDGPA